MFEGPGIIETWCQTHQHTLTRTRFFAGEVPPAGEDIDLLIILGGPMGVYEEKAYPWLRDEKKLIDRCGSWNKKMLGICLGAQLIANVRGARVYPNTYKEIGWFPVRFTTEARRSVIFKDFPDDMTSFHWHGDTFDLPDGALHCAFSEACTNQAFLLDDRIIGLQFHLETTERLILDLIGYGKSELRSSRWIQPVKKMRAGRRHLPVINRWMFLLLDRLVAL